ncbi:MAG: nucleotidyltransferase domain-containing protein [Patescibacteria group bacterium]
MARLEYYPVEKLKKELKDIAAKYLDLKKYHLFFFGSRVTGKGSERSDIDVGIEGT